MTKFITTIAILLWLANAPLAQAPASEIASQATHKLEEIQHHLKHLKAQVEAALSAASAGKEAADKEAEAIKKARTKDASDEADKDDEQPTELQEAMGKMHIAIVELHQQLQSAGEKLAAAHDKAAAIAPSRVAIALAVQKQAFDQAGKERDPKVAESGYGNVAKALGKSPFAGWHGAARLKALAAFKRADLMVRRGKQMQRSRRRGAGESLLKAAAKEFEQLVNGPDFEGEWGTSLHACALRRSVGIYGAFYERYIGSLNNPRVAKVLKPGADAARDKGWNLESGQLTRPS